MVNKRKNGPGGTIRTGRRRATPEYNLGTVYPDIAREWHPEKNGDLTPADVTPKSTRKVWWKGTCGHEWITRVAHRTDGKGCPICARKKANAGNNSSRNPARSRE